MDIVHRINRALREHGLDQLSLCEMKPMGLANNGHDSIPLWKDHASPAPKARKL
jgi:hypothetical protein